MQPDSSARGLQRGVRSESRAWLLRVAVGILDIMVIAEPDDRCPGVSFRGGLTHMAFYADSAIQTNVPRIRHREDLVAFTHDEASARKAGSDTDRLIGEAIEMSMTTGRREAGKQQQVFLLSAPDDIDTVHLGQPIRNHTVTESGRPWAWTMGQRYISLAGLTRPGLTVTSDLAR